MANRDTQQPNRWQRERREFIEHRIFWHGSIGLADLLDVMEISRAQASKDLNGYIADHPGHLFYDKSARTYVMGEDFEAHYLSIDPAEYLADLAAVAQGAQVPKSDWIIDHPSILTPTIPARGLEPTTVRNVLLACAQRRQLSITYQSMSSPEPTERGIAPHGLAHDGFRWHARAYCFRDGVFKDFVLSRMLTSNLSGASEIDPALDTDWVDTITLQIAAHPALSDNQRRVVELDYGMIDGIAEVVVRKCLLFYNLKRLGLDTDPDARRPQDQHIVLINAPEVQSALERRES
ncbi:WYL domain-containing protein [Lentibacter sp. XHP0401]|uniref:WYL domain-containing protein n=1 Tax=Lentibacter sp. XHP0401 TaxID=2984334 RepID=UPI0021E946F1|nr:WYL domain-containing protein [Lentibacter sp. XHP0401]MCV2893711.1 WYL domain-containing protein [Lentibacter sp. XHP0401]